MENTACEAWVDGRWKVVPVRDLINHRLGLIIRCQECHGAVRLHRLGKRGTHRAHAEHLEGNPGCSLGHYFDGTRRLAQKIVGDPVDHTGLSAASLPEEIPTDEHFVEGAAKSITINAYERDPKARMACLQHHGASCLICCLRVRDRYQGLDRDVIHVHHLRPLSDIRGDYRVNPRTDLIPICPLCHAVVHSRIPAYTPDEVRAMLPKESP